MSSKVNVGLIVKDHWRTLYDVPAGRSRPSTGDILTFYFVPAVAGALLYWSGVRLPDETVAVLVTAYAVLAGLLFNLLVLTHRIARDVLSSNVPDDYRRLLREVYTNISYAVLIAFLTLLLLIAIAVVADRYRAPLEGFGFFALGHFLLTMLMVVKRAHVVLRKEFDRQP